MSKDRRAQEFLLSSCSLLLFLLTALWVRSHAHPNKVGPFMTFLSILSYGLGLAGVILLPLDISAGGHENYHAIELILEFAYWGTFFLAYIALPFARDFVDSGHFTFVKRWRHAYSEGIKFMVFGLVSSALFVVILAVHLKTVHVLPVLMTLGNTYGLLLVIVLLGYGLVDIPRLLMRWAKPHDELKRIYILATKADEILYEAVWELQDAEAEVMQAVDKYSSGTFTSKSEIRFACECLVEVVKSTSELPPLLQSRRSKNIRNVIESHKRITNGKFLGSRPPAGSPKFTRIKGIDQSSSNFEELEETNNREIIDELATLHARLKWAQISIDNAVANFRELLRMYRIFVRLVDIDKRGSQGILSSLKIHGQIILRGLFYRILATISLGLSCIVLWCECTMFLDFNMSPFWFLFSSASDCEPYGSKSAIRIFIESVVLSIPLLYMSTCVYWSLIKVTMFTSYKLNANKLTSATGLLFTAQNFIRMQFALGYNFLLIINFSDKCDVTAFSRLMSNMDTVPFFGTDFSLYAPILILFFSFVTYFNVYPRLVNWIGLEHEDAIILALAQSSGAENEIEEKLRAGESFLKQQVQKEDENLFDNEVELSEATFV